MRLKGSSLAARIVVCCVLSSVVVLGTNETVTSTNSTPPTPISSTTTTTAPVCNLSAPAFNLTAAFDGNATDIPELSDNGCTTPAPNATTADVDVTVALSASEEVAQAVYRVMCVVSTVSYVGSRGTPMTVLLDAQLVGLLSLSSCANPVHREVLSAGTFLALPAAVGEYDTTSVVHGALLGLLGWCVLQVLGWIIAMQVTGARNLRDPGALEAAYFPAFVFGGFIVSVEGLAFAAVTAFADPDRDIIGVALGILCGMAAVAGILTFNFFRRLAFQTGYYRQYTFIKAWGELPPKLDGQVKDALRYYPLAFPWLAKFRRMSPWIFDVITPDGTWFPNEFLKRFAPCVDALTNAKGPTRVVTGIQLARVALTAAVSAAPALSGPDCALKHGVVALFHGLSAVAFFVLWSNPRVPQRQPLLVASSVGSMFASIGLAHPLVYHFVPSSVLFLCVVWFISAAVDVAVLWFEWTVLGPTEEGIRDSHRFTLRRRRRLKPKPEKPPPPKPPTPPPPESEDPEDADSRSNLSSVGFIESRRLGPLDVNDYRRVSVNPLAPRPLQPQYESAADEARLLAEGQQRLRHLLDEAHADRARTIHWLHRRPRPEVEVIRRRMHGDEVDGSYDWGDL